MSNEPQQQTGQKPLANFRDGAIQVTVWPQTGKNGTFYQVERSRSYKDKDDQWQKTSLIPERDMLKARRLEDQAYETIQRHKEQERSLKQHQETKDTQQQPEQRTMQNGLDQAHAEAMANVPEQQQAPAHEPSREP